ncbi:HAD-IIIC family phosphatase [Micromonospora sp. NPDC048999]|uniref:HAD-IIIC family phosphatase n=1 Tax=Micromonospora sp. NPDC048999 TaxID=3155391 RepID=UPI003406ABA6
MFRVRVIGSFTVDPVNDVLEFWTGLLDLDVGWQFGGFGQVFQELLGVSGVDMDGRVVLVRLADWLTDSGRAGDGPDPNLSELVDELAEAVRVAAGSARVAVVVCPSPSQSAEATAEAEESLISQLAGVPGAVAISSARLLSWFPEQEWHEPFTEELGRMPYTRDGYAMLGTAVARAVHGWLRPAQKVVVADCDGTLWDGVVGEVGVDGVEVSPGRRRLQELLIEQVHAGRLLCLNSRNDDGDVREVLQRHPDMLVRDEHVTAIRANWQPKPENLRSLSTQLGLALDDFLFVDDDPVQVAEMRSSLPQVTSILLPPDADAAVSLLTHSWLLDTFTVTRDDSQRGLRYREHGQREQVRARAGTLAEFLDRLRLTVTIDAPTETELERVAQLTARTNQFNLTGQRYPVADLAPYLDDGTCLVVRARDRFGDYGLVGVTLCHVDQAVLVVDAMLLSCRALGRGIEHRMMADLGTRAIARGLTEVRVAYVPTGRNLPAYQFLAALPGQWDRTTGTSHLCLTAAEAAAARYQPDEAADTPPSGDANIQAGPTSAAPSEKIQHIATNLTTAAQIVAAVQAWRGSITTADYPGAADEIVPPQTSTQRTVMQLWAELLTPPPRSITDNFFELNGDSLKLVGFMGQVRQHFGVELPVNVLFETTLSIAEIAAAIDEAQQGDHDVDELDMLAGQLRVLPSERIEVLLDAADDH